MKTSDILKFIRKKDKLTQLEMSEKTGLSQSYIAKLENGGSIASPENISVLMGALNPSMEDFAKFIQTIKGEVSALKYKNICRALLESNFFTEKFFLSLFPYMSRLADPNTHSRASVYKLNKLLCTFIEGCSDSIIDPDTSVFSKSFFQTFNKLQSNTGQIKISLQELTTGAYYNEYLKFEGQLQEMHKKSPYSNMDFKKYRDTRLNSVIAEKILDRAGILPSKIYLPAYAVIPSSDAVHNIAAIYLTSYSANPVIANGPEKAIRRLQDFYFEDMKGKTSEQIEKATEVIINYIDSMARMVK